MIVEKGKRLFVIAAFSIIFILFLSIILGLAFRKQVAEKKTQAAIKQAHQINWEEIYPYNTTIELVDNNAMPEVIDNSIMSKVDKIVQKIKNASIKNWTMFLYNYEDIAKLGYIINSRLTDPSVGVIYVKLKNGHWIIPQQSKISLSDAKSIIVLYASLQQYLQKNGIPFLYFFTPLNECAVDNELPNGVISYSNENNDTYIEAAKYYNVDYVDLRTSLHQDNLDHYSMFYATDHHWTVEAGLWAASKIIKEINSRYGFSMPDPYEAGPYQSVRYEKAEFGSAGQGVTKYVVQPEDLVIPYPQFKTNYRLEIPNKGIDTTGSFEEIFIDNKTLQEVISQGGGYAFEAILYGNMPYVKISNYNNPNGPKILMIRDSFAVCVAPYLAESCSELVLIDTRVSYGVFSGSIISCIKDFKPNVVLALLNVPQAIVLNK